MVPGAQLRCANRNLVQIIFAFMFKDKFDTEPPIENLTVEISLSDPGSFLEKSHLFKIYFLKYLIPNLLLIIKIVINFD